MPVRRPIHRGCRIAWKAGAGAQLLDSEPGLLVAQTGSVAVGVAGCVVRTGHEIGPQTLAFSIDRLPDGRLVVIDGPRRLLLRQEPDGVLESVGDLTGFGAGPFNELVVTL